MSAPQSLPARYLAPSTERRQGMAPDPAHTAQSAVRRQRSAHRARRPHLHGPGTGSQISALDVDTGALETISAKGGDIVAPDDLAFDADGNLYATEVMDGRVSVRGTDGRTRVLRDDLPCANGITVHQGRLFVDECRKADACWNSTSNGGAPRVMLDNLPFPNAMEVGPDGLLYFPLMAPTRSGASTGAAVRPRRVVGDLGVPDAVKFDSNGYIVSTQVASGQVLRIDPRSGERTVLASSIPDWTT